MCHKTIYFFGKRLIPRAASQGAPPQVAPGGVLAARPPGAGLLAPGLLGGWAAGPLDFRFFLTRLTVDHSRVAPAMVSKLPHCLDDSTFIDRPYLLRTIYAMCISPSQESVSG